MKVSVVRAVCYLGMSLLLLTIGFSFGSYYSGKRATYVSDACTLIWLRGIDQALDKQDLVEARHRADLAIDCNVGVLSSLNNHLFMNFIAFNSPWIAAMEIDVSNRVLADTNKYYLNHLDRIRPETRTYLASYTDFKVHPKTTQ